MNEAVSGSKKKEVTAGTGRGGGGACAIHSLPQAWMQPLHLERPVPATLLQFFNEYKAVQRTDPHERGGSISRSGMSQFESLSDEFRENHA